MDYTPLQRAARKVSRKKLQYKDLLEHVYMPLYAELEKVSTPAAEAFRDAIWHKDGKWHGAGLGAIPIKCLAAYAIELEQKAIRGENLPVCEYSKIDT